MALSLQYKASHPHYLLPGLFPQIARYCLASSKQRILYLASEYQLSRFCTLLLFKNFTFSYIFKEVKKILGANRILWCYSHWCYLTDT